ncbi:MAG: hypothetical protein ACRDPC_14385 [Solirubrobacteraceae bacterium]
MSRGMPHRRPVVAAFAFGLSLALLLVTAAPSPAPVEPRNCGMITVKGKRYQIKADQVRCRTAKTRARRYLRSQARPSGYRCRSYDSSTKLKFRCWKGKRVYFAIRR